ncbi:MAG: tRNA (adenosine(37)-N6)-threonylcarbamoyltransferase complex dimerization subunit type 1 TsaB [Gammaproteobacteria bacterium MedPE]|nr:MAG: tRNA (adenosine(37)-N6)-threonylcarbamoyltransferase complex dimerization subunit type 1 TsaB [Gammaproteobacteria bacterium MedPE]
MSEKILIIDTSTEACSVAVTHGEVLFHQQDVTPRSHTKMVLPMVDAMLKKANLTLKELDAIAWGRGPGSFTGVRIGTGIMQGLALGANKPVIGISTLATMAQQAMDEHGATDVIAAIDARMNEVYWGVFKNIEGIATLIDQETVVKPEAIDNAALEDTKYMAVGTAWAAYPALKNIANIEINTDILYPSSHAMAPLAKAAFRLGLAVDVDDASPVYVRDTVTWQKLPGRN